MALPELRGEGRLLADVRHGTTKTDKPWASALVKFPVWRKVDDEWEEGEAAVASVVAYEDNALTLARYAKGDAIGVHGTVKPTVYKDKPQLTVTATAIWTPERKARSTQSSGASRAATTRTGSVLQEARAAAQVERDAFKSRRLSAERTESAA